MFFGTKLQNTFNPFITEKYCKVIKKPLKILHFGFFIVQYDELGIYKQAAIAIAGVE